MFLIILLLIWQDTNHHVEIPLLVLSFKNGKVQWVACFNHFRKLFNVILFFVRILRMLFFSVIKFTFIFQLIWKRLMFTYGKKLLYFKIKYTLKKSEWQYICLERNRISPAMSVNKGCHSHPACSLPTGRWWALRELRKERIPAIWLLPLL